MSEPAPRRQRLSPEERKRLLRVSARQVFADRGYAVSGLAEIAEHAGVNKRLLYYYYPEGRSELFVAVLREVADDLVARVHAAASAPLNTARRTERLVTTLLDFTIEQPDAYGLLFREPLGAREPDIVQEAAIVRAELSREVAGILAAGGAPISLVDAVSVGTLAYLVSVVGLAVDGEVDRSTAVDACLTCVLGALTQLGG